MVGWMLEICFIHEGGSLLLITKACGEVRVRLGGVCEWVVVLSKGERGAPEKVGG